MLDIMDFQNTNKQHMKNITKTKIMWDRKYMTISKNSEIKKLQKEMDDHTRK